MGKMKELYILAQNQHSIDDLVAVINTAEKYQQDTVVFEGRSLPLTTAKAMLLVIQKGKPNIPGDA